MRDFGIVSRVFRAISGCTAEEEADILGISTSLLHRYENGKRRLSWENHQKFVAILVHTCEHYYQNEVVQVKLFLQNM